MDGKQLKQARQMFGEDMTQLKFAHLLGVEGDYADRTVRRWERGERKVPGSVAVLIEMLLRDI